MVNKHRPHVLLLPEDAAIKDVAIGFLDGVDRQLAMHIERSAGGWAKARDAVATDCYRLAAYPERRLVVVIDFDGHTERGSDIEMACPAAIADRVFVVGPLHDIEDLRKDLQSAGAMDGDTLSAIGQVAARDCREGARSLWSHDKLIHNEPTYRRLLMDVRPILFED